MSKEFSWDDHPIVEETSQIESIQSNFNWDAHPIEEVPKRTLASEVDAQKQSELENRPDVSKARALLVGSGQGATFGFGEELTAPIVAATGMTTSAASKLFGTGEESLPTLPGESTLDKFTRLMQEYRDIAREEQKTAQEQQPIAYTTGEIAGSLLSPGLGAVKATGLTSKIAKSAVRAGMTKEAARLASIPLKATIGASVGAGLGGVAGLGEAEGTLEERLPQAKETAKTGALLGTAIPLTIGGVSTIKKGISKLGNIPAVEDTIKAFQRGVEGQSLVTKAGREEAAKIVREKSGDLYKDIKSLQKDVGSKIQNEILNAQESGKTIDLSEEVNDVLNRLQKIKTEGSQEAAAYASSVEKEIKKVLGIKTVDEGFMGVPSKDLPEGLILPKKSEVDLTQIKPEQAQTLKQVLSDYIPKKNIPPQQLEPARVAGELRSISGNKLSILTEQLPELNEQYSAIKDSLKRLGINEKKLPSQIQEKINSTITKLEGQNLTGDNARQLVEDVLTNIKKIDPILANKYQTEFSDIAERLNLANKIIKGADTISVFGTPKAVAMATGNIMGLAAGKVGGQVIGKALGKTGSFVSQSLTSPTGQKSILQSKLQSAGSLAETRQKLEPYILQRKVAAIAENAEPEFLQDQANQIREKYGKQGESLATILDNMSEKDKDARRALMFSVLQNKAYKKMLGLLDEQEEQ